MLPASDLAVRALSWPGHAGPLPGCGTWPPRCGAPAQPAPRPVSRRSTCRPWTGSGWRVCSTSTPRRCCTSRPRARPATPTAPTASGGPSSSGTRTCGSPPPTRAAWSSYLGQHPEVSDVLVTGGDPMIMSTMRLRAHLEPLLDVPAWPRSGSAPSRWPTGRPGSWPTAMPMTCSDSSSKVIATGRTLAVMAHVSHPRELSRPRRRPRGDRADPVHRGGALRPGPADGPRQRRPADLGEMWRTELAAGVVPYYLFVARDTGAQEYYKVPLVRAAEALPRRLVERVGPGPHGPWPGDVGDPGQGRRRRPVAHRRRRGAVTCGSSRPATPRWSDARSGRGRSDTAAWVDELEPHPLSDPELVAAVWGDRAVRGR